MTEAGLQRRQQACRFCSPTGFVYFKKQNRELAYASAFRASRVKDRKGHVIWIAENCYDERMKLATGKHLRQVINYQPGGVMLSVNNRFLKVLCRKERRGKREEIRKRSTYLNCVIY